MAGTPDDRVYWAHQLHATLLNSIGAAILQSQVCEQAVRSALPTSAEELVRLRQMLVALEGQTRTLAASATPPDGRTLSTQVAAQVRAARRRGLMVRLRMHGRTGGMPRHVVRGAGVVLAEALANAGRHARATAVEVDVTVREGMLLLRVRDDGVGCEAAALEEASGEGRCGIAIMRAQAQALGGRLALSAAPRRGMQVTLFVPLPPSRRPTR